MKLENNSQGNIGTAKPQQKPASSFGSRTDPAGPVRAERAIPVANGNPPGWHRPMFVITGVALCMGLSSCMFPYDSYGGGYSTVTTYRTGYRVNSLPVGYRSEIISGNTYYYHDGYYYRRNSGGYVVVDAPRNSRYYDDYGRRQKANQLKREYQEPPSRYEQRYYSGDVITRLPDGHRVVNHRGNTYYQVGDRYYRRENNRYVIVSRPY